MKYVTRMARIALGAIVLSSSMAVAENCRTVTGTISALVPVPRESCPSPYGCFTGTFSGDLSGTFQSVLTYAAPTPTVPRTNTPTVTLIFTALTAIETRAPNGTLYTSDAGSSYCTVTTDGQLFCPNSNEVLTITSGLRGYATAYGSINLSGPYMAGAPGAYEGQICTGNTK